MDPAAGTLGKTVVVTVAGRAQRMLLVDWATGSALVSIDDDGMEQGRKQSAIIAYSGGKIVRRERRTWAD